MQYQDWLDLQERYHRDLNQLSSDISAADRHGNGMSSFQRRKFNQTFKTFRQKIKRLESELKRMGPNGGGELQQRLNSLKQLEKYVETSLVDNSARRDMDALQRDKDRYKENEFTEGLSQQQLMQQQQQQMDDQDQKLGLLADELGNLVDLSQDMTKELNKQSHLLDDIDDAQDRTHNKLLASTQRVEDLEESSTSCWTYLCMLLLFMIIVLLLTDVPCMVLTLDSCKKN